MIPSVLIAPVIARPTLLQGKRPGTVDGKFLRHVMLFKSVTATVLQRVLARELHGRSDVVDASFSDTLGRALRNGSGEMTGFAQLMVWNTIFGYGAMTAKDLAKGRTPRDPNDAKTWMAPMVQGGGLGIYGDFLFGEVENRYGGGFVSTLMGPTAGSVNDVAGLYGRVRNGDDVAATAFRDAVNNAPFMNL
ncbi:MAG TPA: hypothetical protein VKA32_07185, partial [Gammaproteobacteria bacterium]|nr:hypothetical protein [Gammaproteobacteria bacterium]